MGIDGLMPRTRSDAGSSRVLPDTAITEIYRLKQKFPKINATLIHSKLIADGFIKASEASLSTVQRFIKKNAIKCGPQPDVKDRKVFETEFPSDMYQADTSHTIYVIEGKKRRKAYLIHIVDDHSQMVVSAKLFYHDDAYNFKIVLKEAIARYGLCKKLYMDNGGPYANRQLKLILTSLGIVESHAPVRDGAAKAKVERSFRTIKDTWLNGFVPDSVGSLKELNELLADYVRMRNTSRNRSIGETPLERYSRHLERIRPSKSQEWLDECFMNRVHRRVRNDSTISIDSIFYDVPLQFIGLKVEVRFLPDDMKSAYIPNGGQRYPIRTTNKVENFRTRRNNPPTIDYSIKGEDNDV